MIRMACRPRVPYVQDMISDERWRAVTARDPGADGHFVYAVRSTGVYCRPSCPARRPLARNVEYFPGSEEAEAGGYRACRRCGPRGDGERTSIEAAVAEVCRILDRSCDSEDCGAGRETTLSELGRRVGVSPSHLQRQFKRLVGVSPRAYLSALRLERAKGRLRAGSPVTAAAFDAGFGSTRAFYESAGDRLGMTPSTYRNGGAAETVFYAMVTTSLGPLLVARTQRGVCAIRFEAGDAPEEDLAREFPAATIRRDEGSLGAVAEAVVQAIDGRGDVDLPLDVRGTAFQLRVWEALRAIPRGETRAYAEVARAIGRPTAVRAVAGACAANPVAVLVPCHRVVGSDGRLTGYRWGTDRKQALLEAEGAQVPPR